MHLNMPDIFSITFLSLLILISSTLFFNRGLSQGQEKAFKIILLREEDGQDHIEDWFKTSFNTVSSDVKFDSIILRVAETQEDTPKVCDSFANGGSIILDVTWSGNDIIKKLANDLEVPYIRIDASISPFLILLDGYLDYRNSTDVSLIFDNTDNIDQALYFWIDTTRLRMVLTETLDKVSADRLKRMRPTPNNYAILADTANMTRLFEFALQENLVTLPERWNLVFLDFNYPHFNKKLIYDRPINLLTVAEEVCCNFLGRETCECPRDFVLQKAFLTKSVEIVTKVVHEMVKSGVDLRNDVTCDNSTEASEAPKIRFHELLDVALARERYLTEDNLVMRMNINGNIEIGANLSTEYVAKYVNKKLELVEGKTIKPIKPFYRIGITHARPWSYQQKDELTSKPYWTGYCADFARKLGEIMNFDFEFVEPKNGTLGEKRNGVWDGVIGDLATGETDLAITTIIMTADREEVVDFVAPYFEQTGISIVMRKPVRKTSLFKFMTVLKLEVWLSIVAALVVTGFMVWFLDRYSPYSARNNKKAYPYPCREFSLKESFWFALTSFTPQGGGEAPKALSGRTLVAAYWLFVVLMLATFTANLAAFLTVERMQTPVQSLEQLAKQSRINYTVVKESDTHQYFINMKNAEDILYRMWKELTLNASTDDIQYRVWDYPIREQYGHILLAINDSNPVANASEGFRLVNEYLDGDFAFIHDSSEIKYEISRNCNLTEVGEVFAEKPYAVAVQQGSHLQDDISRAILRLQKMRFFEHLQEKYWNHSAKGSCPNTDDNEGITLESLGGVFIATLFGLTLAMITLAGEVIYYRRKRKAQVQRPNGNKQDTLQVKLKELHQDNKHGGNLAIPYPVTIGTEFRPIKLRTDLDNPMISTISLYPRARNRITQIDT